MGRCGAVGFTGMVGDEVQKNDISVAAVGFTGMVGDEVQKNDISVAAVEAPPTPSTASLRWRLLKSSLLTSFKDLAVDQELRKVSRRPTELYNLIPWRISSQPQCGVVQQKESVEVGYHNVKDVIVEYLLPVLPNIKLTMWQRCDQYVKLHDLAVCQKNSIDNTGIIGLWPAEAVLAYFCGKHPETFRNKTVIELGSGYGLGGLAIAACTEAAEVVITDGNPEVVDYIQQNIRANKGAFGSTRVSGSTLFWSQEHIPLSGQSFDLVVAADCTFFKDFHVDLAFTIRSLLGTSKNSRAILFNPRRGNTLDLFVNAAESLGLNVEIEEKYDAHLWDVHQQLLKGDQNGLLNYDSSHCYPLFSFVKSCSEALSPSQKLAHGMNEIEEV